MRQHLSQAHSVAAGLRALPHTAHSFAAAQAAWRFYQNARVTLPELAAPLLAHAKEVCARRAQRYALVLHDFSGLHYTRHVSKEDRIVLYGKADLGYLLETALLVSDVDGHPIAPLYLGLTASDGTHSTRRAKPLPRRQELAELSRVIGYVESLTLPLPAVHIIDRQADSLLHLRRLVRRERRFVIRSDELRRVEAGGESRLLRQVEAGLSEQMQYAREVEYKGQRARQYVAEARVVLRRRARCRRPTPEHKEQRKWVPGRAIELRLVVAQVRNEAGAVLATWRLWTNLADEVSAGEVALWYYWRWRIESFFKLLKRGGQQLEQWQQESAEAIAKRLLIVAQACVVVWELEQAGREAETLREFLVRLSGRLMKRGVSYTAPALLAGLWQFLAIIDALERHTSAELLEMARSFLQIIGLETEFKDVKELV